MMVHPVYHHHHHHTVSIAKSNKFSESLFRGKKKFPTNDKLQDDDRKFHLVSFKTSAPGTCQIGNSIMFNSLLQL